MKRPAAAAGSMSLSTRSPRRRSRRLEADRLDEAGEERRLGLGHAPLRGRRDELARRRRGPQGRSPRPRAGSRRTRPAPQPRAASSTRARRRVDVVELLVTRGARRYPLGERAPRSKPGRHSSSACRCGWRPATVAPERGEQLLVRDADQSAHTPHARSSLSRVSPKSKTAARSLTARAERGPRRRCARPQRPSSATARRRRSRTCRVRWSWMRPTSTLHDRHPRALLLDHRAPDRGERDVPGGEDRHGAARVLAQPRERLPAQRQREHELPRPAPDRGRDRDRVRLPRRRSRAPRRSRPATKGSSSMPRGYPPRASDLLLEQPVRPLELLVGGLVDRRRADLAVDARVDRRGAPRPSGGRSRRPARCARRAAARASRTPSPAHAPPRRPAWS